MKQNCLGISLAKLRGSTAFRVLAVAASIMSQPELFHVVRGCLSVSFADPSHLKMKDFLLRCAMKRELAPENQRLAISALDSSHCTSVSWLQK